MHITTRQINLHRGGLTYGEIGDSGPTLLMLHGFAFRQGLHPFMERLGAHFRVIAPDLPFSNRIDFQAGHTLENYAGSIIDLIDALGLEKVSLFGNSVGGTLGLLCCLWAPGRIDRLVIRCPLWSKAQLPFYLRIKPLVDLHILLSGISAYNTWALDLFYNQSAKMSDLDKQVVPGSNKPYISGEIDPAVLSRLLGHLVRVEIGADLHRIENETLVLWGGSDRFIDPVWGNRLSGLLPNSRCLSMDSEYHNITTADPDALSEIFSQFILNECSD
jgi:pimeloyl-ACP methyl ester carboxylesterase